MTVWLDYLENIMPLWTWMFGLAAAFILVTTGTLIRGGLCGLRDSASIEYD
jgi:hypothetical protein